MAGEYKSLMDKLTEREWHGPGFVWFPIGRGWFGDVEWHTRDNHDEKMFGLTFKVVKPR